MNIIKYLTKHSKYKKNRLKKCIKENIVFVNGVLVQDINYAVYPEDMIEIGQEKYYYEKLTIIGLNKPQGYMSSHVDEKHPSVRRLLPDKYKNLIMVGRLDLNTTGILLFTNDGVLANNLIKPESDCFKSYRVTLKYKINDYQIFALKNGVVIYETYITKEAKVKKVSDYEIILDISEGKFHQVKVMLKAVGNYVIGLERISFGPYKLSPTTKIGAIEVLK